MIEHRAFSGELSSIAKQVLQSLWLLKWYVVATLAPAALGSAVVSALMVSGLLQNSIITIKSSLSEWILYLSVVLSILTAVGLTLWEWRARLHRQAIAELQEVRIQAADDRLRFIDNLYHALRGPLTAVSVGMENLAEAPTASGRQELLEKIKAQIDRLSKLVIGLQKLVGIEKRPLEQAPVDVVELLQQVVDEAKNHPRATDHRPSLRLLEAPWPLPTIVGDELLLSLAVYNLLDNALKFTQLEDMVVLRAFEDEGHVVIEVVDTGPGIPEADKPHVWKELFRGQNVKKVPGSGLGLALVSTVVQRHGGHISLDSRVGQGTIIKMHLPVGSVSEL
jgi:two-component system OmpR family sensor kinase